MLNTNNNTTTNRLLKNKNSNILPNKKNINDINTNNNILYNDITSICNSTDDNKENVSEIFLEGKGIKEDIRNKSLDIDDSFNINDTDCLINIDNNILNIDDINNFNDMDMIDIYYTKYAIDRVKEEEIINKKRINNTNILNIDDNTNNKCNKIKNKIFKLIYDEIYKIEERYINRIKELEEENILLRNKSDNNINNKLYDNVINKVIYENNIYLNKYKEVYKYKVYESVKKYLEEWKKEAQDKINKYK